VSRSNLSLAKTGPLVAALSAVMLAGCSGRDTENAERVAEITANAARAEQAALRAEAAVAKMRGAQPPIAEAEPGVEEPSEDNLSAVEDGPPPEPDDIS